ncbi:MAG: hypothetical protein KBD24_03275 [Candidatus Pacebacteria bacterium]|nr:hypothetical protein [Candidatus Paceibacterota bacterium]
MEEAPKPWQEESIGNVVFNIVEKSDKVKAEVMGLLHEYPDHFVHGLFEQYAENDFQESDVVVAYDKDEAIGCLMFNRQTNEYTWLAVKKGIPFSKLAIAKKLFESFYSTIEQGAEVHFFVNTEDAVIPGKPNFSGKNFEPARRLCRSMGLEISEENRVENKYGAGAHAHRVAWVPNKKESS